MCGQKRDTNCCRYFDQKGEIKIAADRKGYHTMRSRFLNFGDDATAPEVRASTIRSFDSGLSEWSVVASAKFHDPRASPREIAPALKLMMRFWRSWLNCSNFMKHPENPVGAQCWTQLPIRQLHSAPLVFDVEVVRKNGGRCAAKF